MASSTSSLNEYYSAALTNSERARREEVERAWREHWATIHSLKQQEHMQAKACSGVLLSELAGSLSLRARPASSSGASTATRDSTQSLADRLSRITSARNQQQVQPQAAVSATAERRAVANASAGSARMETAASAPTAQRRDDAASLPDASNLNSRKVGKAESLRLLVRGTPDQQMAKRVHEAEKSLPRVMTTGASTRPTVAAAAPPPPHTSPSSRRFAGK